MELDYFNVSSTEGSTLGILGTFGESTTTEKSNSDILNDTLQTFQKVISTKDMVSMPELRSRDSYMTNQRLSSSLNYVLHFC